MMQRFNSAMVCGVICLSAPGARAQDAHPGATTEPTLTLQPSEAASAPAPAAPAPSAVPATIPPPAATTLTIAAERPGFGDTTSIVPAWHLQLETGYTFTFRDRDGTESRTHNAPEVLVRFGLIEDRLEVRASTSGYVWSHSESGGTGSDVEGFSDMSLGAKLKLLDQNGFVPRLLLEGMTTVGLGNHNISNRDVEPTFRLIGSWDLGHRFALTVNAGATYATASGERFWQGLASASLGYSINDRLGVFAEYYVVGPRSKGTDAAHAMDFGGAWLMTNRVQLDARVGFGINNQADNFLVGAGLSFLF